MSETGGFKKEKRPFDEMESSDVDISHQEERTDSSQPDGFTIIGEVTKKTLEPVTRTLPSWLSQPTIISSNLRENKFSVREMTMLDSSLLSKLEENGVSHFFPVQQEVIPWLLKSFSTAMFFRPKDICVSAPTGSGKTLSYVLPIVHEIKNRQVPLVRAVVILPVTDLAVQVFKVFQSYISDTSLKVALIVGEKPHEVEAKLLVKQNVRGGFSSPVDIVVASPGSLIHHIQRTEGFSLHDLRFLVVDEADRMIQDIQEGWLSTVEKAIQSKKTQSCQCRNRPVSTRLLSGSIVACCLKRPIEPCQKMLFSATLSNDPEKLKMLSLFSPKLFTSVASSKYHVDHKQKVIEKFSTPQELSELTLVCETQMKPLILWYLLRNKHYKRVLCFTNTKQNSYRLTLLLKELGDVNVEELSAHLKRKERQSILNKFATGKLDVLVCSDMMARGMDMEKVQCVVCYDVPLYIKTYIHRIGRTARAGQPGTALTLLYKGEVKKFNQLMESGERPAVQRHNFDSAELTMYSEHYQNSLEAVGTIISEKEHQLKQSRNIMQRAKKDNK